ncbi:drug/metabolite transporter (DMT)-like permease [Humitalea rosea]|uniref:Drug/metabolite transporter (DMT)-like permease n=1 Tax=Humitalea rosea TaxID=990373 RepID=A0A2W7IMB6_9PROT|nr:DMT family transporter [Humitalea rosea]PZW48310.1 drug/metabolite transporter (DMT)-like permease [Humitalea rosea]
MTPRWIGLLCLLATALGWGLNWPAMKLLLQEWPPLFSRGVAGVVACGLLALIARHRGERLSLPPRARLRLVIATFTNVIAWMGLSTMSMRWVSVSEGALLVYSMPLWAMILAWPLRGTRPTARGFVALMLGLAGIGVLLAGQGIALDAGKLVGIGLALGAAVCFALGTILNGGALPVPPVALVAWQVGLGCAPMLLLGLAFEHPDFAALTPIGGAVLVYMTLVPMGACYLTWFAALRHLPPAVAATGMLLVPLVGVVSAALMLGEPLGLREAAAIALTLGGVGLALRKG